MSTAEITQPKYPDIEVELSGHDGNAFFIIGRVRRALRQGGASAEECDAFSREAMSGDYDNVLQTCMCWVDVA
jgi:hypothetical protein